MISYIHIVFYIRRFKVHTLFLMSQDFLVYFKNIFLSSVFIKTHINELIFLFQNIVIAFFTILASRLGKMGLTAFVAFVWIMANFLVQKEVILFGSEVITSDGLAIGINSGLLLLSYYYGQKVAKQAIIVSSFLILFFLIISQIHLWYIPSAHDFSHSHYVALFEGLPRILCTSLFVSSVSAYLNLALYAFFSRILFFLPLAFINAGSLGISQVVDTVLFACLALYGTVSNIGSIIIFSCCIKFIAIGFNVFLMAFVQKYLSKPYDVA